MALTTTQVSQLYVALFGRASEGEGNKNWVNHNKNMIDTAALMLDTDAAKNYFGEAGETNYGFVEVIYKNTLGFDNAADIAAWAANLDNGMSRAELVTLLLEEALSSKYAGSAPQNQLINRIEVSDYMANNVETVAAENVASTQFQSLVHPNGKLVVTDDKSTVSSAESAIDEMSGGTVIDGETFMLTAGSETITGTDKNDLITGVVSSLSSEKTLDSADVIDGGAGIDTLRLDMKGNLTAITGSVSNVENVNLTNATTIARTFDAKNFSGVEKYTLDSAKGISLSNVAATGIEVAYEGTQGSTTIGFASKATDATTDAMSISLNGVGAAQVLKADGTEKTGQVNPTITMVGIEDVTLKSTGTENFVNLDKMDAKTLTISGDANLDIKDIKAGLTTLDASTMTGALTADLQKANATELKTVSTGSGDDELTIDAASLVANATISGGAGNDTLTLTDTAAAGSTLQLAMSGVETVALSNTNALTFSAKNVTDLTTIQVNETASGAAASFVNTGSADMTVNTVGDIVAAQDVSIDTTGSVTVNLTDTATNAAANKAKKGAAGADNVKIAADMTFANASSLTFNVGDYTEYTGTATGTPATGGVTASKATDVTLNVNSSKNSATTPAEQSIFNGDLNVAKATNVTINSQGNTTLKSGSDLNAAETVSIVAGGAVELVTGVKLDAAANVTLSGEEKTSSVKLDTVGTANTDYDVTVNATGLKDGLTLGAIASKQDATVNLTGTTGNVVLGTITAANVTLNAANLAGILSGTIGDATAATGNINSTAAAANTGAAVVDVSSSAKDVTVGNISGFKTVSVNASSEAAATAIGAITALDSVSVDFSGNLNTSEVGAIKAKAVTIDASNALKAVTIGAATAGATLAAADITITDSLTYTAGLVGANTVAANPVVAAPLDIDTVATTTDATITLNGNIGDDKFDINIADTTTNAVKVTVAGNLDIGENEITITAADNTDADNDITTGGATIDLSGVTAAGDTTISITGSANNDTIKGSAVADTIIGGAGADTLTGNGGADIFKFTAGDSLFASFDTITDFNTGNVKDVIDHSETLALGGDATTDAAAGNAQISAGGKATFDSTDDTLAKKIAAVAADLNGVTADANKAGKVAFFEDSGNTYVFITDDKGASTDGDDLIELTGVTGLTTITIDGTTNDMTIA